MIKPIRPTAAPPTISGPAQGVELSVGQDRLTSVGAEAVPSEATIREMPSGTLRVVVSVFSAVNSCSHRSEPSGLVTVSDSAAESGGAAEPDSDSAADSASVAGSMSVLLRATVSLSLRMSTYGSSPSHALTSSVRP